MNFPLSGVFVAIYSQELAFEEWKVRELSRVRKEKEERDSAIKVGHVVCGDRCVCVSHVNASLFVEKIVVQPKRHDKFDVLAPWGR